MVWSITAFRMQSWLWQISPTPTRQPVCWHRLLWGMSWAPRTFLRSSLTEKKLHTTCRWGVRQCCTSREIENGSKGSMVENSPIQVGEPLAFCPRRKVFPNLVGGDVFHTNSSWVITLRCLHYFLLSSVYFFPELVFFSIIVQRPFCIAWVLLKLYSLCESHDFLGKSIYI